MPDSKAQNPTIAFTILALAVASLTALQSLMAPVLPAMQHDLHTTQTGATWIMSSWLLSAAVATPLVGKAGDMIGRKRAIVVVLALIAIGTLVSALAPNLAVVLIGRVLQGFGGALSALAFGMLRDIYPAHRVPGAIGLMSSILAIGSGLGIVLAGPIVSALDWRWLFWLPMILVVLLTVAAILWLPDAGARAGGRISLLPAALLAGWLIALLLPLSEGSVWGWSSPLTQGLFVLAVVLLVLWIVVETRVANPVIDMKLMRMPAVWTTNLVAVLFGAIMFAILTFLPQLVQTPRVSGYGLGLSVTGAGLVILPMVVGMGVTGPLSARISCRISFRMQLALTSVISAVATAGIAFLHGTAVEIALWGLLYGIGLGFAYAALSSLVVQSVPAAQTGVATGMNANIRTIGGAIGTAVVASVVTAHVSTTTALPLERGYVGGFALLAVFAVVATGVALLVPRRAGASADAGSGDAPGEASPAAALEAELADVAA
ncbi:MAG: MFS transporter [Microbacteriaceae bacterium]|nr:MFS transporter [Microbacteriaceae bacterium]MCL2794743.1 MFS transporter [Microbacteriaceae bacterium]